MVSTFSLPTSLALPRHGTSTAFETALRLVMVKHTSLLVNNVFAMFHCPSSSCSPFFIQLVSSLYEERMNVPLRTCWNDPTQRRGRTTSEIPGER